MLLYELRNNGLSVRRGPFDAVEREEAIWVGIYIYSLGVLRNFEAGALLRCAAQCVSFWENRFR